MSRRSWSISPLLLAAPLALALAHGAPVKPDTVPAFREGLDAMSSHLWDIAGARFETVLQSPDLDAAGRKTVLLRLAETRIRAGEFAAADKILADAALKDDPELAFWKAQSAAAAGKLRLAADLLDDKTRAENAPHRSEAVFTRAAVLQSLGAAKEALDTLAPLLKDKNPANVEGAKLKSAALLLTLNQPADALAILPAENSVKDPRAADAQLLRARASLAKGDTKAASRLFTALLEKDDPTLRLQQQDAVIGQAQSLLQQRDTAVAQKQFPAAEELRKQAGDVLLAYLQQNETSNRLGPVFEQLFLCLPPAGKIAPNDAILTRLEGWMPPESAHPTLGLLAAGPTGGADSAWPSPPPATNDFNVQALYYSALGQRQKGQKLAAQQYLNRLRIEYPAHPLALRALWQLANWSQEDGDTAKAALAFDSLQQLAASIPGESSLEVAAKLKTASTLFSTGDYKKASAIALEAAEMLAGGSRTLATVDAASALLAAGDLPAFDALSKKDGPEDLSADLALERALYLASHRDSEGAKALDRFIISHPGHPRLAEARLASAHAALESAMPDLALAKAQVESIPADAEIPAGSLALAKIRIATRSGDWNTAVTLAQDFLKAHPGDPREDEISYELGQARFQNGDFNAAQLAFEKLAGAHPDGPLAQPSLYFAASSAARGATAQAKQQSLGLFDRVIATRGALSNLARLEKANVQIGMNNLAGAIATLDPWLKSMKKDDPLRMSAGLLLGDALYASGDLSRALVLYADLLADLPADSPQRYELKYRSGLAFEKNEEDGKALEAYYSVLDSVAPNQKLSDWQWIDKCGVGARRLLEGAQKWDAAIEVAKKHARLGSPGAKEAGERARTLGLEHMIMQ